MQQNLKKLSLKQRIRTGRKHQKKILGQQNIMTLINIKRHQKIKALGYGTNDVGELLDDHIITIVAKIKKYYRRILENIRFLARQSLPFHGNQSNDSKSEEETNFHQLLLLRSLDHQDLVKWLNSGSKIQYASPEIQNEILKIMSLQVLR